MFFFFVLFFFVCVQSILLRAQLMTKRVSQEANQRTFKFDTVIPEHVSQEGLYEKTGLREMVASVLSGINVSVIAYGQTGSFIPLFHPLYYFCYRQASGQLRLL